MVIVTGETVMEIKYRVSTQELKELMDLIFALLREKNRVKIK